MNYIKVKKEVRKPIVKGMHSKMKRCIFKRDSKLLLIIGKLEVDYENCRYPSGYEL